MFAIRPASARDIPYLYHVDVQCCDNPWEEGTWLCRLYDCCVSVGTYKSRVVGFSVGSRGRHLVTVDKVAVQPGYRRRRLSTKLLMPIVRLAVADDSDLLMVIPETHLPEAGLWAKVEGFLPATSPVLPDYYTICGEPVDGIALTYRLKT